MDFVENRKVIADALAGLERLFKSSERYPDIEMRTPILASINRASNELRLCFLEFLERAPHDFRKDLKGIEFSPIGDLRTLHFSILMKINTFDSQTRQRKRDLAKELAAYDELVVLMREFRNAANAMRSEEIEVEHS